MSQKRLNATITIGGAITSALKSALGTTRDRIYEIGGAVRKLEREQKLLGNSIQTFGAAGKNVDRLRARYAAVTLEIEKTRKAQQRLIAANEMRAKGGSLMARGGLMIGGAVAAAATLGKPIRAAAEFEHNLQMIGNTANMTGVEIGALKKEIFAVSQASNKGIADVTSGIGFLIAAGMSSTTAAATIGTIATASTATGTSVEDLAKAVFTLNDSLNISPEQTKAALNILAQAGKEGNVELKDMAKQLPVLGSAFKSLKMDGGEAVATMGAALEIARKGAADADEAANNMKNFLAKITSPETLNRAKNNFGIDLYKIIQDAQTTGKNPFEASMQAIITATQGDQKKIGELFGDMQAQNFLRPMIQQWGEYKRIKDAALNSGNVIDADFARMMQTTKEQAIGLGNAWTRLMTTMGDSMAPAFGEAVKGLTGVVNSTTAFVKENPSLVRAVLAGTGVVIGLTAALGAAKLAVGGALFAWSAVPATVTALGTAFTWLSATALPAVASGFRAVGLAIAANPIGAVVAGIAVAAVLVYANWKPIKAFFIDLWGGIKQVAGQTWEWMKNTFFTFHPLGIIVKNWVPIKGFFAGLFADIRATVASAIDWVLGKIAAVGDLWGKTKAAFGFGASAAPARSGASYTMPNPPPMATARGGNQTINNNVTAPITINQQPGQNSKQLADEVARRLEQKQQVQRRGAMYDRPMGY